MSARCKSRSPQKPLTCWKAKDRHCQQGQNLVHHRSHSLSGEPRTGIVSRVKIQLTTKATHPLQAPLAGLKSSSLWKPLTIWRAKDMHCQQGPNTAYQGSRERQGHTQATKKRYPRYPRVYPCLSLQGSHSPSGEPRTCIISRVKRQLTTEATHQLESRGQTSSAGLKYSSPRKPLTGWRVKDRHC